MRATAAYGMSSSLGRTASGYWVIEMTCQPCAWYHLDSALVANRGPAMTTTVPPSWTVMPSARPASTRTWRSRSS